MFMTNDSQLKDANKLSKYGYNTSMSFLLNAKMAVPIFFEVEKKFNF